MLKLAKTHLRGETMESLKFGTSGLRGLAVELTGTPAFDYTAAFLRSIGTPNVIAIGQDLRPSSEPIAQWVAGAAQALGVDVVNLGALPTPALAMWCDTHRIAGIMITGSHIPDDRNGLKFYTAHGEINKADEAAILAAYQPDPHAAPTGLAPVDDRAIKAFKTRYVAAFSGLLSGLRVGVYQHSSVARDFLVALLADLGATAVPLGRSDSFIPVDTEALRPEDSAALARWANEQKFDAIVSTDGDADRPLIADENGQFVLGDTVGALTARFLNADMIVTPVTSNSALENRLGMAVVRTRVGSPYVIEAMADQHAGIIVGFEANGGVLLGSDIILGDDTITALPTRDCVLPILSVLADIKQQGMALSGIVSNLEMNAKYADRLQNYARETSEALLTALGDEAGQLYAQLMHIANAPSLRVDRTDGLKFIAPDITMHFRPSGNAPELRVYCEAATPELAQKAATACLSLADRFKQTA